MVDITRIALPYSQGCEYAQCEINKQIAHCMRIKASAGSTNKPNYIMFGFTDERLPHLQAFAKRFSSVMVCYTAYSSKPQ